MKQSKNAHCTYSITHRDAETSPVHHALIIGITTYSHDFIPMKSHTTRNSL